MRAAVKVASVGVNGKLRGASSLPRPEQSVTTVAQKSSRPASAGIATSPASEDGMSPVPLVSQNGKKEREASVQRPSWEFDDWEFTGTGEELILDSVHPTPRVVFGGVPTLKEAKEATCDLKGILDRKSTKMFHEPISSVPSLSGCLETKDRVTSEDVVVHPSVSKPAIQAFKLLNQSPEAQSVVAALACDKNIWHAVMQNEKVVEFIKKHQTSTVTSISDDDLKVNDDQKVSRGSNNEFDGKDSEGSDNIFAKLMHKIKLTVEKMLGDLSELVQNILGGAAADVLRDPDERNTITNEGKFVGASFMALAVLAIVVVVMKRT